MLKQTIDWPGQIIFFFFFSFHCDIHYSYMVWKWKQLENCPWSVAETKCRRRQEGTSFYLNIQIRNNFNLYQNKYSFHIMESWPWLVFELSKRRTKSFPHGLHLKNIYNDKYVKYNNKCQLRMTHNSIV